jgi:hypothetical protein
MWSSSVEVVLALTELAELLEVAAAGEEKSSNRAFR